MVRVTVSGGFGRSGARSPGAPAASRERGWGDCVGSWPGVAAGCWGPPEPRVSGRSAEPVPASGSGTSGHLRRFHRALVAQAVLLVLRAEVPHRGVDHPAGRVAQAAEAAPVLQALLDPVEDLQVDGAALAGEDAVVRPQRPVAADAAGSALAAGLVGVELEQAAGGLDHAVRIVHHDDAAG